MVFQLMSVKLWMVYKIIKDDVTQNYYSNSYIYMQ
jgi:hypothetical protein